VTSRSRDRVADGRGRLRVVSRLLWVLWHVVRLPILALLLIVEPIVRIVLSWAALLGLLCSFLFEFAGNASTFPFWGMIAFSFGCALTLMVYYMLLSALSK